MKGLIPKLFAVATIGVFFFFELQNALSELNSTTIHLRSFETVAQKPLTTSLPKNSKTTPTYSRGIIYNLFLSEAAAAQLNTTGVRSVQALTDLLLILHHGRYLVKRHNVGVALFLDKYTYSTLVDCSASPKSCPSAQITAGALATFKAHVDFLEFYEDAPPQLPRQRVQHHLGNPTFWWRRINALRRSPFNATLMLDLDARICPPFHKLFHYLEAPLPAPPAAPANASAPPGLGGGGGEGGYHLVGALARSPHGGTCGDPALGVAVPREGPAAAAYRAFPERNLGAVGARTGGPGAAATRAFLARYEAVYLAQMATPDAGAAAACFRGDQAAWREALFLEAGAGGGGPGSPGGGGRLRERLLSHERALCRGGADCAGAGGAAGGRGRGRGRGGGGGGGGSGCLVAHRTCGEDCREKRVVREFQRRRGKGGGG